MTTDQKTQANGPVTTTQRANPAWKHALKLAKGDVSRLRVVDDRTVLVVN